ncbi:hypothetical protein V6Z11_D11G239300 [Gossypium hirsutum]
MLESRPSDPEPPDPKPIWSFFCQKLYQTESSPSCSLLVVYGFYPHLSTAKKSALFTSTPLENLGYC